MIKEGKFGVQEAVCLATTAMSTKLFYSSPGYLTRIVGTAGWYMTIISNITALIAFSVILLLFYIYPGKNMIEIFEISLGRVIGFIFSILFGAYFLFSAGTIMREFLDIFKIYVLPETPLSLLALCVLSAVILSASLGLESIARVSKIFGYSILVCLIIVLLLCTQHYKAENLYPLLGYGIGKTVMHGMLRSSVYSEVMILTVFASSLQGTKYLRKAGYLSLLISGGIVAAGLFCFTMAFPVHQLQELAAPMFILARSISYGEFFQRLDPFFVFIWTICTLITVSILFYSAISCYNKTFRIQDRRVTIFPMSIFLFIVAIVPKDFLTVVEGSVQIFRENGWIVTFLLPIIALIVTGFRRMVGD